MKHAYHAVGASLGDHRACIVFRVPSMDDNRLSSFARKEKLLGKCAALLEARRIVVMIVEPAFTDRYCTFYDEFSQLIGIAARIEAACIVRMNSRRVEDEPRIFGRDCRRSTSGAEDVLGAAA